MGLSKRLMAVGTPAEQAKAINGVTGTYASVSTTVSQAAATPLLYDVNVIPNAQAAGAVLLPSDAVVGDFVTVTNYTGSNVSIYPSSGGTINGGGTNAAITLATASTIQLQVATTTATGVPIWYIT